MHKLPSKSLVIMLSKLTSPVSAILFKNFIQNNKFNTVLNIENSFWDTLYCNLWLPVLPLLIVKINNRKYLFRDVRDVALRAACWGFMNGTGQDSWLLFLCSDLLMWRVFAFSRFVFEFVLC